MPRESGFDNSLPPSEPILTLDAETLTELQNLAKAGKGRFLAAGTYQSDVDPEWFPDWHSFLFITPHQEVDLDVYPDGRVASLFHRVHLKPSDRPHYRFRGEFFQDFEGQRLTDFGKLVYFYFDQPEEIPFCLREAGVVMMNGSIMQSFEDGQDRLEANLKLQFSDQFAISWSAYLEEGTLKLLMDYDTSSDPYDHHPLNHIMPAELRGPSAVANEAKAKERFGRFKFDFRDEDGQQVMEITSDQWSVIFKLDDPKEQVFRGLVRSLQADDAEKAGRVPLLVPLIVHEVKKEE